MTSVDLAVAAVLSVSAPATIACAVQAYRPGRATLDAIEQLGPPLREAHASAEAEPLPADLAGLLGQIDDLTA